MPIFILFFAELYYFAERTSHAARNILLHVFIENIPQLCLLLRTLVSLVLHTEHEHASKVQCLLLKHFAWKGHFVYVLVAKPSEWHFVNIRNG